MGALVALVKIAKLEQLKCLQMALSMADMEHLH